MVNGELVRRYEELRGKAEGQAGDKEALADELDRLADEAAGEAREDANAVAVLARRLASNLRTGFPAARDEDANG